MNKEQKFKQLNFLENLKTNKNVIFLSDFYSWEESILSHYFFSNFWHLFRVVSPVDVGVKKSVNLFFKSSSNNKNKGVGSFYSKVSNKKFKYIKTLNINDNYLDYFLKELC